MLINAGTLAVAVCRHLEASTGPRVVMVPDPPPPRLEDSEIEKAIKQISFSVRKCGHDADCLTLAMIGLQSSYVSRATPNQPFYAPFLRRPRRRR
jgi:hypothetical protein